MLLSIYWFEQRESQWRGGITSQTLVILHGEVTAKLSSVFQVNPDKDISGSSVVSKTVLSDFNPPKIRLDLCSFHNK